MLRASLLTLTHCLRFYSPGTFRRFACCKSNRAVSMPSAQLLAHFRALAGLRDCEHDRASPAWADAHRRWQHSPNWGTWIALGFNHGPSMLATCGLVFSERRGLVADLCAHDIARYARLTLLAHDHLSLSRAMRLSFRALERNTFRTRFHGDGRARPPEL